MAAQEIMHIRDLKISERHRHWGVNCPAVDLDFVLIEFDRYIPCGLTEMKHANTGQSDEQLRRSPGARVLRALAEMAGLPAWIAVYNPAHWGMHVLPLNELARDLFGEREYFSERAYVVRLMRLRGQEAPAELLDSLNQHFGNTE